MPYTIHPQASPPCLQAAKPRWACDSIQVFVQGKHMAHELDEHLSVHENPDISASHGTVQVSKIVIRESQRGGRFVSLDRLTESCCPPQRGRNRRPDTPHGKDRLWGHPKEPCAPIRAAGGTE